MLSKLFPAIVIVGVALVGGAVAQPASAASRMGNVLGDVAPASAWDCANACNDCQGDCNSRPAGNVRQDCVHACTAAAAKCCAGYGKKPPSTDCYCR
jgi:hypothetical protein